MEVVDPFVPSFQPDGNGFGEIPQEWSAPFMPAETAEPVSTVAADETGVDAAELSSAPDAVEASPETEPVAAPQRFVPVGDDGGAVAQAKDFAEKLAATLGELQHTLDQTTDERYNFLRDQAETQERVRGLEAEAARKEEFKALLQTGSGATLSTEDLETLQSMTDALTQDPDRLTLLFNVVQQAPKLATAINVYTQLRRLADQS